MQIIEHINSKLNDNEANTKKIKRGYYEVGTYNVKLDFSGQYTSLTLRSDG